MADPGRLVECHSGNAYAERPVAFWWEGQRFTIDAIVSRSRSPSGPCFHVRTPDGEMFELAYDESKDAWEVMRI